MVFTCTSIKLQLDCISLVFTWADGVMQHFAVWHHLELKHYHKHCHVWSVPSDTVKGCPALTCCTELYRYMGATFQQDFWDCVIICSEFKLWRDFGKTNSSVLCAGFECICCVGFTGNGDFWQFSVSPEACALCFSSFQHTTVCVDGCSAFPSKEDVQSSKRKGRKRVTECERGESKLWWKVIRSQTSPACKSDNGVIYPTQMSISPLPHRPEHRWNWKHLSGHTEALTFHSCQEQI